MDQLQDVIQALVGHGFTSAEATQLVDSLKTSLCIPAAGQSAEAAKR